MSRRGYNRYEISNYAKIGYESKHNLAYWHYDEYIGIGPGAHSRLLFTGDNGTHKIHARMNYNSPTKWLSKMDQESNAIQTDQILSSEEVIEEIIMMGLRINGGITDTKLQQYLGLGFDDVLDKMSLKQFTDSGFVNFDGKQLSLTDKGMLMHSYIVPRVISGSV